MVRKIASLAPKAGGDLAKLLAHAVPRQVADGRRARQGDGRHHRREHERAPHGGAVASSDGVVADYVHNKVADGLGKIGVLVALESKGDKAALATSAASSPCTSPPPTRRPSPPRSSTRPLIERERAVYVEQAKADPASRRRDRRQDGARAACARSSSSRSCCCSRRSWVRAATARRPSSRCSRRPRKTVGAPIKVARFVRYALGEGIEKKDDDFAAEVAKAAGKR